MKARDIMSSSVACCTPQTSLQDVAKMMVDCDCGAIPVVDELNRPIGMITDRDIVCRLVARGQNPLEQKVEAAMSRPAECAREVDDLQTVEKLMEQKQLRRIPVVDDQGCLCGIIAQADIARRAPEHDTAEVVRDISQPSGGAFAYH